MADEGFALMSAAFAVHNEVGGGLSEEIYQECLELELADRSIVYESQVVLPVFYKGQKLKRTYIPDLLTHGSIVVELKSVSNLAQGHEAQLLNYMRLTRKPVGYLINFAPIKEVEWKRYILSEFTSNLNSNLH